MAYSNRSFSEAGFSDLGISPNVTVAVTGFSATASVNSVFILTDAGVGVNGNEGTVGQGSVTVTGAAVVSPTGVSVTGATGTLSVIEGTGITVSLTGAEGTGEVGDAVAGIFITVPVTGVTTGATSVGNLTYKVTYSLTGVSATTALNSVTVWGIVVTGTDEVYTEVSEGTANIWTPISSTSGTWTSMRS